MAIASLAVSPSRGADRNADFIDALRAQGWDDTAVDYLQWVETSPLATDEFRQELDYQRALSLAAQGKKARNAERERLLTEAAAAFQQFAKNQPDSPQALEALRQAAGLLGEQAMATLAGAARLPEAAVAQRDAARVKARQGFEQATAAAAEIVDIAAKELATLPKAAAIQADPQAKARHDHLSERQVEAQYLTALLSFERAAVYQRGSAEFNETINDASRQFGDLHQRYRTSLVGVSSRYYQGRCAQELGRYEKALGCYEDLLGLPPANLESRRWTSRAHRGRVECLLALDKIDEAVKDAEEWLAASRPAEREEPQWLEVAYRLAEAYQAKANADDDRSDPKQLQSKARNILRDVAKGPNEFQHDARLALAAIGKRSGASADVKTFADAFAAGKTSLELWNSSTLAAKLARENNPEAVEELQQEADGNRSDALALLEAALGLADRQTPIDQLNAARYYLCILYWEDRRFHEAAVLAEFIASRYPESEHAASAAKVALAAYEQAALEAASGGEGSAGPSYEARKLAELAELVAARWPESPEAASAVNVLIQSALRENRLSDAEALLERLPAASRGAAQMSLGAGLWTQYLRNTAGQRDDPGEAALALRKRAGALLSQGFESLRQQGDPTTTAAVGALYLVQYQLAAGDAGAAIDALEDKTLGPLPLVESGAAVASKPQFVLETYKAALRAYLSAQPPRREAAERMMTALEAFVAGEGADAGAQQLTDVYLSLGIQLQAQMKELTAAGQAAKASQVASAFGDVLDRVAARPDADSWRIRSWIAQTNLQLGQGLSGDESRQYVDRARSSYEAMLAAAAKDKSYAPDANAVLVARLRLGDSLAAMGQFQAAVKQYGAILAERPTMLDVQQSAATALQQWGVAKRDVAALDRSIRGDLPQPDGKNLIWGWLRMATTANAYMRQAAREADASPDARQRAERFSDLFFEARLNVARSRYLAGTVAPAAERAEHLQSAKTNIEQMMSLYPDLGGPKWKAAFAELLDKVNQELARK